MLAAASNFLGLFSMEYTRVAAAAKEAGDVLLIVAAAAFAGLCNRSSSRSSSFCDTFYTLSRNLHRRNC